MFFFGRRRRLRHRRFRLLADDSFARLVRPTLWLVHFI